jgi:hypothetical protein
MWVRYRMEETDNASLDHPLAPRYTRGLAKGAKVLFVHQVHQARSGKWKDLARLVREELIPGLAASTQARVVWCARPMNIGWIPDELITLVAIDDAKGFEDLRGALGHGALNEISQAIADCRGSSQTRILKSLSYNPFSLEDLHTVPVIRSDAEEYAYMHDFVQPRIGRRRLYEEGMRQVYASMSTDDLASVVLWMSLEPLPGGGPFPEQVNISRVQNVDALATLLEHDIARDNPAITEWMKKALQMRDTWTTRLVRALPWSPLS